MDKDGFVAASMRWLHRNAPGFVVRFIVVYLVKLRLISLGIGPVMRIIVEAFTDATAGTLVDILARVSSDTWIERLQAYSTRFLISVVGFTAAEIVGGGNIREGIVRSATMIIIVKITGWLCHNAGGVG